MSTRASAEFDVTCMKCNKVVGRVTLHASSSCDRALPIMASLLEMARDHGGVDYQGMQTPPLFWCDDCGRKRVKAAD